MNKTTSSKRFIIRLVYIQFLLKGMHIKKFNVSKFTQVFKKNTLDIISGSLIYGSDKSKKITQQNI